jgi:hypothetical protein
MKSIDFTQPGGFPLTQERLGYLQDAYTEAIAGLSAVFTNGSVPVLISGMVTSFSMGMEFISPGYFFYDNKLVRFGGASLGPILVGNAAYVVITETALPLTYNDGSSHNVIIDRVGGIGIFADTTPADATRFPYSSLQRAAVAFADANVNAIKPAFVAGGGGPTYSGSLIPDPLSPIGFRKAHGSKRVVIKGVTNDSLPVSTISDCSVFVLPLGYRPGQEQLFLNVGYGGSPYVLRIKSNGVVSLAGDITGISTPGCWINVSFDVD